MQGLCVYLGKCCVSVRVYLCEKLFGVRAVEVYLYAHSQINIAVAEPEAKSLFVSFNLCSLV